MGLLDLFQDLFLNTALIYSSCDTGEWYSKFLIILNFSNWQGGFLVLFFLNSFGVFIKIIWILMTMVELIVGDIFS